VTVPSTNTKSAPGGYYDVEFTVSYLRLRRGVAAPAGANMAEQIAALRSAEAITAEDAAVLTEGAGFLRSVDHILRLVTGRAPAGLPENTVDADTAHDLARRWGLLAEGQTLAGRLSETQQRLRTVYSKLVDRD